MCIYLLVAVWVDRKQRNGAEADFLGLGKAKHVAVVGWMWHIPQYSVVLLFMLLSYGRREMTTMGYREETEIHVVTARPETRFPRKSTASRGDRRSRVQTYPNR